MQQNNEQTNLLNSSEHLSAVTDIIGEESKPAQVEEMPAMAASASFENMDKSFSDVNSYAVLDAKIKKYYTNEVFQELIELFQENFAITFASCVDSESCKRCIARICERSDFEYRAFQRAVRCLLHSDDYTVNVMRAQSRRKQTKYNKLVLAYMDEIEGYVSMRVRQNSEERFRMQFGIPSIPSSFTIEHKMDLTGYEPFVDMIMHKLDIFSKVTNLRSHLMSLALCIANVWANIDRPATCLLSISQFIMNLQLGDTVVHKATEFFTMIYNKIAEFYKSAKDSMAERFTAQANFSEIVETGFDFTSLIPLMGGGISVLLSLVFLRMMPGGGKFDNIFNRFSRISGVIKSVQDINKLGSGLITTAIDDFCKNTFGVERPVMDEWRNVNAWVDEVSAIMKPGFESDLKNNEQLKNTVESLLQRGMAILRTLDLLKVPFTERSAINQCVMFLMRARETAGNCGAGQTKPRVAPAITHIFGASGVGKSTILWALIAEIQAALGVTKTSDLHEKTYFRRPGAKFWDGYSSGINVVVCDDFGARKDNESNPNEEFLEAIHMSNTAFWQLNMADLQDKRSTYFQAKSVIWTSNRSRFDMSSLTNAEAVIRRVDLKIRQKPHPDFAKSDTQNGIEVQVLDQAKVNKAIAAKQSGKHTSMLDSKNPMLDCILFDVIDKDSPNDNVIEGETNLSFWDIAERVVNTTINNMKYFEGFHQSLEDHMDDAIQRCKSGTWTRPKFTAQAGQLEKRSWDFVMNQVFMNKHRTLSNYLTGSVHFSPWDHQQDFMNCKRPTSLFDTDMRPIMSDDKFKELQKLFAPIKMSQVTYEEIAYTQRIVRSACFCMDSAKAHKVTRAWWTAKIAFDQKLPGEMTDDVFTNLFITACKQLYGEIIPISESELCFHQYDKEERIAGLHYKIAGTIDDIHKYVNTRFGMEPKQFYMIAGAFTLAFGWFGVGLAKKIFKYFVPAEPTKAKQVLTTKLARSRAEGLYSMDKMKALARNSVEYDTDRTKAINRVMTEGYDTDKTKGLQRLVTEGYDTDRAKAIHRAKVELSLSDFIPSGSTAPEGHKNLRGQTYEELSLAEKALWNCMHADVRPIQKKMAAIGKTFGIQACTDQNAAEIVSVCYKNMYKLERFVNGKWVHVVNILIIKGRLALMNRHIVDLVVKTDQWRIRNKYFDGIEFSLRQCNVAQINDPQSPYYRRDVMLVELPRLVHLHKDITSKFMTSDDFSKFKSLKQISAIGYVPSDELVGMRQYFGSDVTSVDSECVLDNGPERTMEMVVRKYFKYNIQTTPGDCGAVLVAFDSAFNNKIFGIHSAGTEAPRYTGMGTPVTQGVLQQLEKNLPLQYPEGKMHPQFECNDSVQLNMQELSSTETLWHLSREIEGNFYELGKAPERVHAFSKSKINPSPVHGVIQEPTMAPAILRPFKTNVDGVETNVDPMARARIKASPISKPINDQLLERCTKDFYQKISQHVEERDRQVMSFEEAIAGVEGDMCYPPMKRSTSPGYGWEKKGKGKTDYLGDGEYVFNHKLVLERYNTMLETCKAGNRPSIIWIDTLKDERRTLAKVKAGKTRLFSCGEMVFTILFRQYFGGFIAHMMRNKIDVESCVGVNCYGMDWTRIVAGLSEVGDKVCAGDFENYDGTLHSNILWKVLDMINEFYGTEDEESNKIRIAIWCEVVNSIHIFDDQVYMWGHSQPSGCPMTTILNCSYHSISARYVFMSLARRLAPSYANFPAFRKYVRHFNYGDDDLWCIADEIIDWFNQVSITEAYKELSMKYTDEAKTGEIVPYRRLSEVNFLKRTFRWDDNQCRYRAPLAMETIKEMAMWNHGTVDEYELCASVLEDAVHELAQHDEVTFRTELPLFEKAARIVGERFPVYFDTYEGYQEREAINCGLYIEY